MNIKNLLCTIGLLRSRGVEECRNLKSKTARLGLSGICNLQFAICESRLLVLAVALFTTASGWAQSFSLDWYSMDGGGGVSTGGAYSVRGTVGQPDAGTMSGGPFSLQGGFWKVLATVPTAGGPTLSVSQNGSLVKIAWPKPAAGWVLESTPVLAGPTLIWTQVTQIYQDDGIDLYVSLNAPSGSAFFRLRKP